MPRNRQKQSQDEKYVSFKKAFGTYNHYLSTGNYIGAFVIAFSILEDRVNALYFSRKKASRDASAKESDSFSRKIGYLKKHNDITTQIYEEFDECREIRNNRIHAAMWNLEEFGEEGCKRIIKCARMANRLRNEQKKKISR